VPFDNVKTGQHRPVCVINIGSVHVVAGAVKSGVRSLLCVLHGESSADAHWFSKAGGLMQDFLHEVLHGPGALGPRVPLRQGFIQEDQDWEAAE
jgi:hypothetical protein